MTCDRAGAGDWQPVGLSYATVITVRPRQLHQLEGREHKGIAGTTGSFWQFFFPQVPDVALVRSTRARPPVPILDLGGYALW